MPAKKKLETKKKISVSLSEDSIKRGEIVAQKKGFPSFSSYLDQLLRADITEDPIHVTLYTSEGTKYTQVKTQAYSPPSNDGRHVLNEESGKDSPT